MATEQLKLSLAFSVFACLMSLIIQATCQTAKNRIVLEIYNLAVDSNGRNVVNILIYSEFSHIFALQRGPHEDHPDSGYS